MITRRPRKYTHGLSESQKDAVRRDYLTLLGPRTAEKHGITRERVRQIVAEPPNEARRLVEIELGIGPYSEPPPQPFVHGPLVPMLVAKFRHFEDIALQDAIRNERLSVSAIVRKYGVPRVVVDRIVGRTKSGGLRADIHERNLAMLADRKTMTIKAVAAKYGISMDAVCNAARLYRNGRLDSFAAPRAINTAQ